MKPAVFFDRDGTLIKSVHYLNRPDQVELLDGVPEVLRELKTAGYLRIIVTNQAAIDKGLLSVAGLQQIQQRLEQLLARQDADIDGWYFSPAARLSGDDETIDFPDRKPGPGMLLAAATDFDISLEQSWMVGDRLSDALAGRNAGCKASIIIDAADTGSYDDHPAIDYVLSSIDQINKVILKNR